VLGRNALYPGVVWHETHVQTLRELSLYHPNTPLLPNLHTINFRLPLSDPVPFARLFLGPSIREVTIPITSEAAESAVELLSSLIPYLSPNICRLNIWSITSLHPPCSAIFPLIQGLHHIRTLNIDLKNRGLHEQVAAQLGGIPTLNSLRLSLIGPAHLQFYTTALGKFPLLVDFSFAVGDWVSAATIMSSMECRFTNLAVTTTRERPLSDLQVFMDSLSLHPSLSTLTHLSLTDFQTTQRDSDDVTYIENIFRPLFACSGLKSLNLLFDRSASLRDSWYADAAAAWPLLETISISSSFMGLIKANMTLEGLIPFAKHCTNLETIKFRLSAKPFDPTHIDDISNTNIRKLCLEAYTVPSPHEVYFSLIRIFPNLEYIYQGSRFSSPGLSWPWDQVNTMLHSSSVRRRGPCVDRIFGCTCGTPEDGASLTRVVKSRPQTPGAVQLRSVMDKLRSRS
jgi:hypothetical protein